MVAHNLEAKRGLYWVTIALVAMFLVVNAGAGVEDGPGGMVWVYINDPGVSGHEGFTGYMSKYETTNAQYCEFLNAAQASGDITVSGNDAIGASGSNSGTDYVGELYYDGDGPGYTHDGAPDGGAARINYIGGVFSVDSGFENHPVTYANWYGATAFCNYYGYRLPTEWEWQAVADHNVADPYNYGCGMDINNSIANYFGSIHPYGTTAVGSFGTYGYGMCDMAGNVWEWTSTVSSSYRVLRGGGWTSQGNNCSVSHRNDYTPSDTHFSIGFRVVRDAEPPCWQEQQKLLASDGAAGDRFGVRVSISGDYAIVGAMQEASAGTGSAYIFKRESDGWIEQTKLTALDGAASDLFGVSVYISGDYAIVGAYWDDDKGTNSGSAYIFKRSDVPNDPNWYQQAKLTAFDGAANDMFGGSVAIEANYAIVGASQDDDNGTQSGSAYIFKRPGSGWLDATETTKLVASDGAPYDYFGKVSISGDYAIVGANRNDDKGSDSGAAYVFKRDGTSWIEQAKLAASDGEAGDTFGCSTSISGNYAIVGTNRDDDKGTDSGSAYIFKRDGEGWDQQVKLTASDGAAGDFLGTSVSITGDYAIVGAEQTSRRGPGSAYIFKRSDLLNDPNWYQQVKLIASDPEPEDEFGYSVSISGNYAIVGAKANDDKGTDSGSAYVFESVCPEPPIDSLIDIDPDTLNKKSHGRWVTVYITLPDGFDVGAIDTSTVAITSLVGESCVPEYSQGVDLGFVPQVGDRDEDGIADLTVKFDRQVLLPNLCLDDVAVTIEGELTTGEHFSGSDTIRIIDRGK
jgi:hypothetical protein